MLVKQTAFFTKLKKKPYANQVKALDEVIEKILQQPAIGEQKQGDLKSVYIYKFKMTKQEYLLAYQMTENYLLLLALGSHENFYRDLKLQRI